MLFLEMPLDIVKIRSLRRKAAITQDQASAEAGLASKQVWQRIEDGTSINVTIATLEGIARTLKVLPSDILLPSTIDSGATVDMGAFAFLDGKIAYTRKIMLDVEASAGGSTFDVVFRGEDRARGAVDHDATPAKLVWNDETSITRRIVVGTYTSEDEARRDVESVRNYFRAFAFDGATREAHLTSDNAKTIARLLVSALGSAPYGAKSGNVRSYHEVKARRESSTERKTSSAIKALEGDAMGIASKLSPAAQAKLLAELIELSAALAAPAKNKTEKTKVK